MKEAVFLELDELNSLIDQADRGLNYDGLFDPDAANDAAYSALLSIREQLANFSQDPDRRKS